MGVRFNFIGMVVLITATCGPGTLAQEKVPEASSETIPGVIDRASTQSSGDFFENRSLKQDAAFVFGIGYDEDKIAKDAQRIEVLYKDLLYQQSGDGPTIRTQDLSNPYTTSIRLTRQPEP